MSEEILIYALVDPLYPDEIRYIGITRKRFSGDRYFTHLAEARKSKRSYKINWIRSLFLEQRAPVLVPLEKITSREEAYLAERCWIIAARAVGHSLTNTTPGGEGFCSSHTAETKARISATMKGRSKSASTKLRMSEAQRGNQKWKAREAKRRLTLES